MIEYEPDQPVDLEVLHDGKKEHRKIDAWEFKRVVAARDASRRLVKNKNRAERKGLEVGTVKLKIAEFPNEAFAYVPENYNPNVPYGLVVWLHGDGGLDWAQDPCCLETALRAIRFDSGGCQSRVIQKNGRPATSNWSID